MQTPPLGVLLFYICSFADSPPGGAPQHFTSLGLVGGVPSAQAHMSTSGDLISSVPLISGTTSLSTTPSPVGNSHPMSYQMMSPHTSMANQHMMTQHGMVPDQYGLGGQPGMGPGHHMGQYSGGQMVYSHMMRGGGRGQPAQFSPFHPEIMIAQQQSHNMVVPQMTGPQSNMVASLQGAPQSNIGTLHGMGGAQSNMTAPQGGSLISLQSGTPVQQSPQLQDPLMSQQTQNGSASTSTSSHQESVQQDGLPGTHQSQVSMTTLQQAGEGVSQVPGMVCVVCVVCACVYNHYPATPQHHSKLHVCVHITYMTPSLTVLTILFITNSFLWFRGCICVYICVYVCERILCMCCLVHNYCTRGGGGGGTLYCCWHKCVLLYTSVQFNVLESCVLSYKL